MYRGVIHGVKVVVQNEGMRGLLRGLSCAVRYISADFDCKNDRCQHTHALPVHLPNDSQRLPSRLLRASPTQRKLPGPHALSYAHHRPCRAKPPIASRQHLRRRSIWYSRRRGRLALLPRKDPSAILLSLPTSRNTTSIQERRRRHEANLQSRGYQGPLPWSGPCDGTNRLWLKRAASHIFLREEAAGTAFRHERGPCAASSFFDLLWLCGVLRYASS
jgi:hypothetical protein